VDTAEASELADLTTSGRRRGGAAAIPSSLGSSSSEPPSPHIVPESNAFKAQSRNVLLGDSQAQSIMTAPIMRSHQIIYIFSRSLWVRCSVAARCGRRGAITKSALAYDARARVRLPEQDGGRAVRTRMTVARLLSDALPESSPAQARCVRNFAPVG
jgi:hypothetical protein